MTFNFEYRNIHTIYADCHWNQFLQLLYKSFHLINTRQSDNTARPKVMLFIKITILQNEIPKLMKSQHCFKSHKICKDLIQTLYINDNKGYQEPLYITNTMFQI